MTWIFVSLLSNVAIIATEMLNRSSPTLLAAMPRTLPLIAIAQVCLYYAFHGAPHWLMAWVVFTVGNAVMRIAAIQVWGAGEIGSWPYAIAGICIMLGGAMVVKQGLS